jgi:uncharacterized protein (TIGR04222 family)
MSPFDLTGGPFLTLYAVMFALALVAGLIIPRWLRPEGGSAHGLDADRFAYLAGGRDRFGEALTARLLATRALSLARGKFHTEARDAGRTSAERSVVTLPSPFSWGAVSRTLRPHAATVESRLVADGLLIDGGTTLQMRFWQTLPYLLLLGFGAIKLDVGIARDRPVGFLTIFLIVTAIFALVRFLAVDRRTRAAVEALSNARRTSERLRRAPTVNETDMAVALFGTTVLVGSGWSDFHQMRSSSSSGDSGSSSSSDGGSGCGGGGGGCGGCGGS